MESCALLLRAGVLYCRGPACFTFIAEGPSVLLLWGECALLLWARLLYWPCCLAARSHSVLLLWASVLVLWATLFQCCGTHCLIAVGLGVYCCGPQRFTAIGHNVLLAQATLFQWCGPLCFTAA